MPRVAKFMCQRGATMAELAHAFKVTEMTLYNWLNRHQEFHDAVQVGVDTFNPRVERALAERAIGGFVTLQEEVRDEDGRVIGCGRNRSLAQLFYCGWVMRELRDVIADNLPDWWDWWRQKHVLNSRGCL